MADESTRAWKDQYMLRLPDGMRARIKAAAEANSRSMNAEIIARLEDSLDHDPKDGWITISQGRGIAKFGSLDEFATALVRAIKKEQPEPKDPEA